MKSDPFNQYLWDGSGDADSTIAEWEAKLAPLRYSKADRGVHAKQLHSAMPARSIFRSAATIGIAITGVWIAAMTLNHHAQRQHAGWEVTVLSGEPRVGATHLDEQGKLRVGEWLQTDSRSQAILKVADIGSVTIEPDTRLRLVQSSENVHKVELARGAIEAFITAPPRLFLVDTPVARAVDLGCKYRLSVDEEGGGELEVTLGWVSLEREGRIAVVPGGAKCRIDKQRGPGTPRYIDATPAFQSALMKIDLRTDNSVDLEALLHETRPRDSMTLWHLLPRVSGNVREAIFERLASYCPLPEDVQRERILAGDDESLRRWAESMYWSPPANAMR